MITPFKRLMYTVLTCCMIVMLAACSPKLQIAGSNDVLYPISADQVRDPKIVNYYQPYKVRVDSLMNEVIAISDVEIIKDKPEGLLNNFFADAMYQVGKSTNISFDFAYTNYGGLRVSLPQGSITLSRVFELMPFENILVTVKFSGDDVQGLFDYMAASGGDPISGAKFKIREKKAVDIMINNQPFDRSKSYTVLTSDYMANGGDRGDIFLKSTDRKEYAMKLRDALITYVKDHTKAGTHLNPKKDGRIVVE